MALDPPANSPKVSQAFLNEMRSRAVANLRLSDSQVSALVSNLSAMNFNQVQELATGPASRLRQLVPGAPAGDATKGGATQGATSQQGISNASDGNATQAAIGSQQASRGGFRDDRGSKSDSATCQACSFSGTGRNNGTEAEDGKVVNLSGGGKAYIYGDGSFVIESGGKKEVYDSQNQPRTGDPKWTANKTPVPDEDGGTRSGSVTRDEWRGILARKGATGAPQETKTSGAGGTRTSTTTAAGTPTGLDSQVSVDLVQLQEALRIAAEKFGPKVGH
jgi:hypothetical protein